MDGPRLNANSYWGKIERKYYSKIRYPDYLIILTVSMETSIKRKPEHGSKKNVEMLKKKISAVNDLVKNYPSNMWIIDSNQAKEDVIKVIKNNIWSVL